MGTAKQELIVFDTRRLLEPKIVPYLFNNPRIPINFTEDFLVDLFAPPGGDIQALCKTLFTPACIMAQFVSKEPGSPPGYSMSVTWLHGSVHLFDTEKTHS